MKYFVILLYELKYIIVIMRLWEVIHTTSMVTAVYLVRHMIVLPFGTILDIEDTIMMMKLSFIGYPHVTTVSYTHLTLPTNVNV